MALRLWLWVNGVLWATSTVASSHSSWHPPDKTSLWTYGIDMDGWTLAHDALRGEVHDFSQVLEALLAQSDPISNRQVCAMNRWWRGHLIHMRSHHENEDHVVKAFVRRRFGYPHFMEVDHALIECHLNSISRLIKMLSGRTRTSTDRLQILARLKAALRRYQDDLLPHLKGEEDVVIRLTRAFFTPNEVQRLTNRLAVIGPRLETGAIVHYVGKDKLKQAMRLQKAPLQRVAWALILCPRYRYYQKHMLASLDVLRQQATR